MSVDEQSWHQRYNNYVRSRDLNPSDLFYEELLKEIFNADDEYWTTLGARFTDRDDQVAYDQVFTLREAYRSYPAMLSHLQLGYN
jgi:hypothetical protein